MLFSKHITIPVNKTKSDPYVEHVKISKGTVRKVIIQMFCPSAVAIGVSIWYSTSQKWPTSRVEWIPGGQTKIEFEENLKIDQPPLNFEIRCYNDDLENTHAVWVGFNILRPGISGRLLDFLQFFQGGE